MTRYRYGAGLTLLIAAAVVASVPASSQLEVNPHGAAVKAFRDRVDKYLEFHEEIAGKLPPLDDTRDAKKLSDRERALGLAIQQARTAAQQGDVFGDLAPAVTETVRRDWRSRPAEDRRALLAELFEDQPNRNPRVKVNMLYPTTLPLATFPASLLRELPPLPEGIEYRFFGRHLILRDTNANLVVDVLPGVIPG
jgi:hypothetical protein